MTAAQRARLVVALGVLNLVLVVAALGVGSFGLPIGPSARPGSSDTVVATPGTTPAATPGPTNGPGPGSFAPQPSVTDAVPSEPPPATEPLPSEPASSDAAPSTEPSTLPSASPVATNPPVEPSAVPPVVASPSPVIVAGGRTAAPVLNPPVAAPGTRPTPVPTATPVPTVTRAPAPTATPRPTPTPTRAPARPARPSPSVNPHPPCPQRGASAPGRAKVVGAKGRPCGAAAWTARGRTKSKDRDSGVVIVLPLAIGAWIVGSRRPLRLRRPRR